MLRAYMLDFGGNWDKHIPLIEFPYNNNYQSSIGIAPYEVLYGRSCKTLICWMEMGDNAFLTSDLVAETTKNISFVIQKLKIE